MSDTDAIYDMPNMVTSRGRMAPLIKQALRLIGPKLSERRACEIEIVFEVSEIEVLVVQAGPALKLRKIAHARIVNAIRRLEQTMNNKYLDFTILRFFPHTELNEWREKCEGVANEKYRKPRRDGAVQTGAYKKQLAIRAAHRLTIFSSKPVNCKRGGLLCKLAALLYGKPNLDLSNQCKEYLRKNRG